MPGFGKFAGYDRTGESRADDGYAKWHT